MIECKINSVQIHLLLSNLHLLKTFTISLEDAKSNIKEMFPEVFEPKQKYCCSWFANRVIENTIVKVGVIHSDWYFSFKGDPCPDSWRMITCPRCGQTPIPPIKEKS